MEIPAIFDLTDKVALVSGASRGIGAAAAKILSEYGAHVILTSRKAENLKEVEAVIKKSGNQASSTVCHNGDLLQIEALFQNIQKTHGRLTFW